MPPFRRTAYLLALFAAVGVVTGFVWRPAPPPAFVGVKPDEVPASLGAFRSLGDYAVAPEVRAALASADMVSRAYSDQGTAAPLDFILIGGTDRSALHDPRSCLVGGGWKLENDRTEALPGTGVEARTCRAVGAPDTPGYDIVYLYVVDGRVRNRVTEIRAEMLASALLGRKNRPVYFLRLMQPLNPDPAQQAEEHKRLLAFAADAWRTLEPRLRAGGAR